MKSKTKPIEGMGLTIQKNSRISTMLLSALCWILSLHTYAQQGDPNIPTVNLMSPNSASLGKYVDYPVNTYTGVPNISIPIYEVKEGPLSLPISMSYHAAGLKVLETASWVGAGWSLNAGGMVSRTVRGLPDEQFGGMNDAGTDNLGSFMVDKGFSSYYHTTLHSPNSTPRNDFAAFGNGQKDGEPDLFFYNFAGYSGEFYFNEAGKAVQLPESDLKIETITKTDPPQSFNDKYYLQGFKITTPDGNKYYFGITPQAGDVDPVEESDSNLWDANRLIYSQAYSSWYLYKIESADRLFSIDLSYDTEQYGYYSMAMSPCIGGCNNGAVAMKVLIKGVRLSSITCSNGTVNFIPSGNLREDLVGYQAQETPTANTQAKRLYAIEISSNDTDFCKEFRFSHDYFVDNTSTLPPYLFGGSNLNLDFRDNKKLKLNSIQEYSCDGLTRLPAYRFEYYDEEDVPRTLSFAQDHWGFYNGQHTNADPFPATTSTTDINPDVETSNKANREAAWPAMQAGSLQSIQYPTGGLTTFEYEANKVLVYPNEGTVPDTAMVGGLRVKKVEQVNNGQVVSAKTYEYKQAQLFSIPNYIFRIKNKLFGTKAFNDAVPLDNGCLNQAGGNAQFQVTYLTYISPSSVHPMVTTQGYHIGYNEVKETQGDGGYTINRYAGNTILPAGWEALRDVSVRAVDLRVCLDDDPVFPVIPVPHDFDRGNIRSTEYYDAQDNLLKGSYFNQVYQDKDEVTFGMVTRNYSEVSSSNIPSLYEMRTARMVSSSQVDKIYDPADDAKFVESESITYYENPTHQLPTRITSNSTRGVEEQQFVYAKDLTNCEVVCPGCLESFRTGEAALQLQFENNVNLCGQEGFLGCASFKGVDDLLHTNFNRVENTTLVIDCSDVDQCHLGAWHDYHFRLNELRQAYASCLRSCGDDNCVTNGLSNANTEVRDIFRLDANNQIAAPIEIRTLRDGFDLNSTFFGYQSQDVGRIYLEGIYQNHTAGVLGLNDLYMAPTGLFKDSNYQKEATTTYKDGVIVQQIRRDGLPVSYIWGYNNTLPIVSAQGIDHATLLAAYDTDPINFRNDPALANALVTTYEYDPLVGLTRQVDPNGYQTTYHYDDLGRLLQVRDLQGFVLKQYEYNYDFSQN